MKRIIKFISIIISIYIIFISTLLVEATAPIRASFVEETIIAGIIPIYDEQVTVNQVIFDLDFYGLHGINIDKSIEKSANLKMTYDLTYSGSNASVRFSLPVLNKLEYLDHGVQILADGVEIKPILNISPQYNYFYDSFTRMVEQNFITQYREKMLSNYELIHDVVGYQYTVKAPKTKGENFLVETRLNFKNVPVDTVFMNINISNEDGNNLSSYAGTLKGEEEIVFFSSSNLLIEPESIEVESYNGLYISYDVRLENPEITKIPMKLSEYLDIHTFEDRNFLDQQKMFFYYIIDKLCNESKNYHAFNSRKILNDINHKYYEMSLEFDIDFYKPQMQVEILLPIPVHCYKQDMTLVVVANPASKIHEFGDLFVNIQIDEKLISSTESHVQESSNYKWSIDGATTLEIVYSNSSYNDYRGIMSLIFGSILKYIVILIIIIIVILFFVFSILRYLYKKMLN